MVLGESAEHMRRRFPPRPSSVPEARRMIRACLEDAGRPDLVETAQLLVSEIVTNALVHAGTPIDVAFSFVDGGLRIEVSDGSPHAPSPRAYGPHAGTGRGLMLLEQMVDEWGVTPEDRGKTVWFQIASSPPHAVTDPPSADPSNRAEGATVEVALLEVPLLLHEAWRQHAESLLREYLLATLDDDGPAVPIAEHAEASDAMALLGEHIPAPDVPDDPEHVIAAATEPLVTSPRVEVPVPVESVRHFATLDDTISKAVALADEGAFLTPPAQPEVQQLRGWLCGQVLAQSSGEAPVPWSSGRVRAGAPLRILAWDTRPVADADGARVAADDGDRIVAVSLRALDLLGYDEPGDLVGRRLLDLIPERFRQAHLAGFSLHFLTGRSTVLGHAIVVPALRRDGTEIELRLTIRSDRADDGREVFVADLEAVA